MVFQPENRVGGNSEFENRHVPFASRDIALYLGYDLTLNEDRLRLARNAEWVDIHRAQEERRKALRPPLIVGVALALITGLITIGVAVCIHYFKI